LSPDARHFRRGVATPALLLTFIVLPLATAVAACSGGGGRSTDSGGGGSGDSGGGGGGDSAALPGDSGGGGSTADSGGSTACGTCPAGYTCGTANGVAVCRAPSGIPELEHVIVIVLENTSYQTLVDSTNTPYLHGLMSAWATSSNYHGVEHPSLPNYIAMTSGGTGGIGCDCDPTGTACNALNCNALLSLCGCAQAAESLADQIEAAGRTWRAYGEDMGTPCNLADAGDYAVRHVPFLYYEALQMDQPRCDAHVVDFSNFAGDMASAPSDFIYVAPNLVHDMHDPFPASSANLANGDMWLAGVVPSILASSAFLDRGALFIVWDEDDLSGVVAPDDPIPFFLLSPLALSGGAVSAVRADHYSLLATFEDGLALPRLGAAASATPLADLFPGS
jgi:hypothetical protein